MKDKAGGASQMKGRLLLIDDNPGMLETLSDILTSYGLEVDTAATSQEAINQFKSHSYNVAVVDIILPGINGVELIRRLKPEYPDTDFLVITAYTDSDLALQARDEQAVGILYKPVDPDQLVSMVRNLVAKSGG